MPKEKYIPPCCLQCRIYQRVECTDFVKVPRRNCFYFEPGDNYDVLYAEYCRLNPPLFNPVEYEVKR
jgi:hypothetical protein